MIVKEIEIVGFFEDGKSMGNCNTTINITIDDEDGVRIPLTEFLKLVSDDKCKFLYNPGEKDFSI